MSLSIGQAIISGAAMLLDSGISEPRLDAGSLVAHVLKRDRTFIIAHPEFVLTADEAERYEQFVSRRARGEPLQYITGYQEFYGFGFEVNSDVLIPRPETESIVEAAVEILRERQKPLIADIGTGSGCLAISLLKLIPDAEAVAADLSPDALAVAQRNAERHNVSERLRLSQSDCFSNLEGLAPFTLIVSNPPYVPDAELGDLQREVRCEPLRALAGGRDGFDLIRRLLHEAPRFLKPAGHFIFEIGFGQGQSIGSLIEPKVWELLEIRNDLQGIPRTVVLRKS